MKSLSDYLKEANKNSRIVFTIKYRHSTLDIRCDWVNGEGTVMSYENWPDRVRAFYDSYDMKEFKNRQEFDSYVTKLGKRAIHRYI